LKVLFLLKKVFFWTLFFVAITICKLGHGQELRVTALARKNCGKIHAKWMPACTCVFSYVPEIKIRSTLLNELPTKSKEELYISLTPYYFFYFFKVLSHARPICFS
jgi:hypothetical protein